MAASLSLPPLGALDAAAAQLVEQTADVNEQALINKAIYSLGRNPEIVPTCGGFLIPSADKSTVYRVSTVNGCSCKGGTKHGRCYHGKMIAIIEEARRHTMPALPLGQRISAARALAEINELF